MGSGVLIDAAGFAAIFDSDAGSLNEIGFVSWSIKRRDASYASYGSRTYSVYGYGTGTVTRSFNVSA